MVQTDDGRSLASKSRAPRPLSKVKPPQALREVRTFAPAVDETVFTETRRGWLEYYGNDAPIGRALTQYGEWAEAELSVLRALCGPGQTIVDVGAHVGSHTLAFARFVGPGGRVLAFEPQKRIYDLLQRNMDANGCAMVKLYQAGVGAVEGEMRAPPIDYGAHANFGAVTLQPKDGEGDLVRILTLDSLDLDSCDLLKIDAEGMGVDVLAGARGVIDRLAPVIAIECNGVGEGVAAFEALPRPGYSAWLMRAAAFNPENFRGDRDNFFGVAREMTLIFVPDRLRGLVPESREGAELLPVEDLDDLAAAILATPRYGDATDFDRDPTGLHEALASAERAHEETKSRLEAERQALAASERAQLETRSRLEAAGEAASRQRDEEIASLREVHRQETRGLEFRAASLLKQLAITEAALLRSQEESLEEHQRHRGCADQLRELDRSLQTRDSEIAALRSSTCWRLTAPLRGFKGLFAR